MADDVTPEELPSPLRDELRRMWEQADPVPPALADRVVFALEVDAFTDGDLELELMRLQEPETVGSRGEEVRTVTFGSESLTVMIAISTNDIAEANGTLFCTRN